MARLRNESRIHIIAAEVAESSDKYVPSHLLKIDDILKNLPEGSEESEKVKNEIWEYDLVKFFVLCLKQDFSKVSGSWNTAAKLSQLFSHICTSSDPPDPKFFYDKILPTSIENMLVLSRRIQEKYTKGRKGSYFSPSEMLKCFKVVFDSMATMFIVNPYLCEKVMSSVLLHHLLLTDDKASAVEVLTFMNKVMRTDREVIKKMDENNFNNILDEIIFKLSISNDADVAAIAIKILLTICDIHKKTVEVMTVKYKGLRILLSRWLHKGFSKDLDQLLMLLDAGTAHQAEMLQANLSAITIQKFARSFLTRLRLKKASHAMAKFQKSYRQRKDVQERERNRETQQNELKHQLMLSRRRAIREMKEKQLEVLETIPPAQFVTYLENERNMAATKIQSRWKGHKERSVFGGRKETAKNIGAAITIQRGVRKWLKRIENKRKEKEALYSKPPGLTDERRVELQNIIQDWRDDHTVTHRTREEQVEIHNRAQEMLHRYMMLSRTTRMKHQQRDALLACIETDTDLLLNAPNLPDVVPEDLELYVSRSVPIATVAQIEHNEELQQMKLPWWKRLDEDDPEMIDPYDLDKVF